MASHNPLAGKSSYKLSEAKLLGFLFDMQATYAIAKYNGEFLGAFKSGSGGGGATCVEPHAEDHAVAALQAHASTDLHGKLVGNFTLKVSKSPCTRCTKTILALKAANPELRIRVKVLGLYTGEGSSDGQGGVLQLRGAGIPVRLWDVRSAYESEDVATNGLKGRELKHYTELKGSHFAAIDKRDVRNYDVAWSGKDEYKTAFSGQALSEEAQLRIGIDRLKHQRAQVAASLTSCQLTVAQLESHIRDIDGRTLAPKDMSGRFIVGMLDSFAVTKQKNGYNNYMDEKDRLEKLIVNLRAERARLDEELKKLGSG